MANIPFTLNGTPVTVDVDKDEELLWVLRDRLDVKGVKYGCGMGLCGACTSHINGKAQRTCITPLSTVSGKNARSTAFGNLAAASWWGAPYRSLRPQPMASLHFARVWRWGRP